MSIELSLAIWGACIATILAIKDVLAAIRNRTDVRVSAAMTYTASAAGADTHGTLFRDQTSTPPAWTEGNIEFIVRNLGEKTCQITHVFVEDEGTAILIQPAGLPVDLVPKASRTLLVQPEVVGIRVPVRTGGDERPVMWQVVAMGVIDGLGKKYFVSQDQIDRVVEASRSLPLRFVEDRTSEPGFIRWGLKMKDPGRFFSKREEFRPMPMDEGWGDDQQMRRQ